MNDGLIRVAASSFPLTVAGCVQNAEAIAALAEKADGEDAQILLTPELGLTGASCGDLFCQPCLLNSALDALLSLCRKTAHLPLLLVVGLPLRHRGKLFNCAAFIQGGQVLALVPKTHLSGPENRWFCSGEQAEGEAELPDFEPVPFGTNLLLRCAQMPELCLAAEIGADLWAPSPPSTRLAMAGATLVVNPCATPEMAGGAEYRWLLAESQSARLSCAYLLACAGSGESTTDYVFSGHQLLAENGVVLAEAAPFTGEMAVADLDMELLARQRLCAGGFPAETGGCRTVAFTVETNEMRAGALRRPISPLPFLPPKEADRPAQFEAILDIQAQGLRQRLAHTGAKTALLGISGGLDSTLALLVTARAFRLLEKPMGDIIALSMPGFGTTARTKNNAETLCRALGVSFQTVDITQTAKAHFADIGQEEGNHDVTFENAQARLRTLVLMDMANRMAGLVVGTGDLSELALGWATYSGDHMSMYGVNAGVPKTLIRFLVAHEAGQNPALKPVLDDILATPVSPELLPPQNGEISQQTEAIVGPYELHDFFLFYTLRHGFAPGKILRFARQAFEGRYSDTEILGWMKLFYSRFFSQQFKRSCLPDGPAVGSVGLSPRGGWVMPSDAAATAFLRETEELLEDAECL